MKYVVQHFMSSNKKDIRTQLSSNINILELNAFISFMYLRTDDDHKGRLKSRNFQRKKGKRVSTFFDIFREKREKRVSTFVLRDGRKNVDRSIYALRSNGLP